MAWHAKPSGPYTLGSSDWVDNLNMIISLCPGWTAEAIAGMAGNMQHESGLNPWRWEHDVVNYDNGYGLPQFTKASSYINLPGTMPNLSVTQVTPGASPDDGTRQMQAIDSDELHKWVSGCWRDYWSPINYSGLYTYHNQILQAWGNGSSVTMSQYKACTDIDAATFMWLACYEGPGVPNFTVRQNTARLIYQNYMGGVVPPTPDPPTPDPPSGVHVPYWLLKKAIDNSKKC
ncbi:MAG: hypothetical protein IKV80_07095 [Bacteroidales bacterium]|nr:hypothetical protein [Bacteroidales bacterium]